ncbi:MAG: ATP-binding cassette domain-containing protein, partial [Clostridia bacterium]
MSEKSQDRAVVLRARNISKEFPGVKALSDVSMEVRRGEVLALLGENGAGKSTLIKILSGVYSLDSGEMELEGVPVKFHLPSEAKAAGIGIIHQELNYVETVSVAENIYMGDIPKKGFIVDYKRMYEGARKIMARIGVDIDPRMPIGR